MSLAGGQSASVVIDPGIANALRAANPAIASINIVADPSPPVTSPAVGGSVGGGDVVAAGPPIDLKIVLKDSNGNVLASADATIQVVLPSLPQGQTGGQFVWLQAVYNHDGTFAGYIRPAADVDLATGNVVLHLSMASLQGTLFLPAMLVQAWIQNFDPNVHVYSGWDDQAVDLGLAGDQFTTFQVVAPQVGQRIYVYKPSSGAYGWIDAKGVGPAGSPSPAATANR